MSKNSINRHPHKPEATMHGLQEDKRADNKSRLEDRRSCVGIRRQQLFCFCFRLLGQDDINYKN